MFPGLKKEQNVAFSCHATWYSKSSNLPWLELYLWEINQIYVDLKTTNVIFGWSFWMNMLLFSGWKKHFLKYYLENNYLLLFDDLIWSHLRRFSYSRCLFAWNPTTPQTSRFSFRFFSRQTMIHILGSKKRTTSSTNQKMHLLMASDIHQQTTTHLFYGCWRRRQNITISKNPGGYIKSPYQSRWLLRRFPSPSKF